VASLDRGCVFEYDLENLQNTLGMFPHTQSHENVFYDGFVQDASLKDLYVTKTISSHSVVFGYLNQEMTQDELELDALPYII
ncbi:hypothetical protein PT110_09755, partial [Erysipelothrix rhusiopathiae]|nr:hypothetical protein [Erysipelothrix rhusiopathiae]